MRFAPTDEQLAFAEAVRDLLSTRCGPDELRRRWPPPVGPASPSEPGRAPGPSELWAELAAMGVTGATVATDVGGLGLSLTDVVTVLEEAGRFGLPEPLTDTVAVGAPLLGELASGAPAARGWLEAIAAGELTVALHGPLAPLVAGAEGCGVLIARRGGQVVAVPRAALRIDRQPAVDGASRLATVAWDAGDEVVLGEGDGALAVWDRALDRGAVAVAAELVGLAERMLDLAVAYVTERRQFGVPVGSFQAVKHRLADALLAVSFARPAVRAAAWVLDQGGDPREGRRSASLAKALAADAAMAVGEASLQCHGAIGYTVEYDLHLYLKRAWTLVPAYGDAAEHRERIARLVVDPEPPEGP